MNNNTFQLFSKVLLTIVAVLSISAATVRASGPVASDTESTPATKTVTDGATNTTGGGGSSLIWWVLGGGAVLAVGGYFFFVKKKGV